MSVFAAFALFLSTPAQAPEHVEHMASEWNRETPSAVRHIDCAEGAGSGFVVGDRIIATARHVAVMTNCVDTASGVPISTYLSDPKQDFALMSGNLPVLPKMEYTCTRYNKGDTYVAVGISKYNWPFHHKTPMYRLSFLQADSGYSPDGWLVDGFNASNQRKLLGWSVPGMSGGPIVRIVGDRQVAYGMVNIGHRLPWGQPTGPTYSVELADTPLCQQ